MTPLPVAPLMTHDSSGMWFRPPAGAAWPREAKRPALANMKIPMRVDPTRRGVRRPHRSMNINAKMVMKTLMTYWIEEAMRLAEPVRPVMPNT